MKSTYLYILVAIIILGAGALFFISQSPSATEDVTGELPTTEQLGMPVPGNEDVDETIVIEEPEEPSLQPGTDVGQEFPTIDVGEDDNAVFCAQDAKQCPDGSFVSRVAPSCAFAACPVVTEVKTPDAVQSETKVFNVSGTNFAFDVKEIKVKKGDTVTINFTSEGGFHDWAVDEFRAFTDRVNAGDSSSVTFVADTAGAFEYYCSVGSHRANGMIGTLIVE